MKTIKGSELVDKEFEVLEDGSLRLIKEKLTRYIPKAGERYWYITHYGSVICATNGNSTADCWLINHQLVFKTEEECKEYKEFIELLDEYKFEPDWKDNEQYKYYLCYFWKENKVDTFHGNVIQIQGTSYFETEEKVKEFIDKAGIDAIKRYMFDVWE